MVSEELLRVSQLYQTPFANSTLLAALLMSLMRQRISPQYSTTFKPEYDYIVIGAGSAGAIVASRLSELECVSVLLLEAGGPQPVLLDVPATNRYFWYTEVDWAYNTVPQKHTAKSLVDRKVIYASGKALGGGSVLQDLVFVRGNRHNFDDWARMGAKGWSYRDVLPYFKKYEDNQDIGQPYIDDAYHGVGGPVSIMRPDYKAEFKPALKETMRALGIQEVDSNGRQQTGFYDVQSIMREDQLCSTAKAYLVPAENRTNLDILPYAYVKKVVIEGGRATGVEFDYFGSSHTVRARREIVVSAGALNTPKILMLSGIGPREELENLGIPVIMDLPVGKNLQDHIGSTEHFLFRDFIPNYTKKLQDPENIQQYINHRTGPLSASAMLTAIAFLKNDETSRVPDHQIYFAETIALLAKLGFGLQPEVYQSLYGPYEDEAIFICLSHLLHPKSRGTITLKSSDPYDDPVIDPNYLAHPQDKRDIVEGLKKCKLVGNHPRMAGVVKGRFETTIPNCAHLVGDDDAYYTCFVENIVISFWHPAGTAKMGHPRDPTTVVDPELRVKGIQGLRVADASIMPILTSGNTIGCVMMIGEKAADIIKCSIGQCPEKFPIPKECQEKIKSDRTEKHQTEESEQQTEESEQQTEESGHQTEEPEQQTEEPEQQTEEPEQQTEESEQQTEESEQKTEKSEQKTGESGSKSGFIKRMYKALLSPLSWFSWLCFWCKS